MASLLFRSAAGRVLQSIPRGSFPRNPVRFFYNGVGRIESKGVSPKPSLYITHEELEEAFRKFQEEARSFIEQEKRFQKQEQRQRVLSYFLVPMAAAAWIFDPDKKKENREGGSEANH